MTEIFRPKYRGRAANGPSETLGLAKCSSNFTGLAVSFLSGYVHFAVSIFIRSCLGVWIFCNAKGLEVPIRSFICF